MATIASNKVSIVASVDSVIISIGDYVRLAYPKGTLCIHADESNTDSVELRLISSRRNIVSFNFHDLIEPTVQSVEETVSKLNNLL